MINNIHIHHFRGIRDAFIDNMGQFNLFLGHNNCGKSTVLDALLLFMSHEHPEAHVTIQNIRQLNIQNSDDIKLCFYRLNTENPIVIEGGYGSTNRSVTVSYFETIAEKIEQGNVDLKNNKNNRLFGLQINNKIEDESVHEFIARLTFDPKNPNEFLIDNKINVSPWHINCAYLSSATGHERDDDYVNFSQVLKEKQEPRIVKILQQIEPSINDIVAADDRVMVDIGLERRIPIQVLGDGIRKVLNIVLAIYLCKNGVILIDELENGLHYSSMPILWKAIIAAARDFNVQVFCTTHNIDSLNAVKEVIRESKDESLKDAWRAFTLKKADDGLLRIYTHTYTQYEYLLDTEREIR